MRKSSFKWTITLKKLIIIYFSNWEGVVVSTLRWIYKKFNILCILYYEISKLFKENWIPKSHFSKVHILSLGRLLIKKDMTLFRQDDFRCRPAGSPVSSKKRHVFFLMSNRPTDSWIEISIVQFLSLKFFYQSKSQKQTSNIFKIIFTSLYSIKNWPRKAWNSLKKVRIKVKVLKASLIWYEALMAFSI